MAIGILAIDDEHIWRKRFVNRLARATPTEMVTAEGPDEAFALIRANGGIRVVLIDQDLQRGGRGSDLCRRLRHEVGDSKIIIGVSSSFAEEDVQAFKSAGADGYAAKSGLRHGLQEALSYPSVDSPIPRSFIPLFTDPGFINERVLEAV